MWVKNKNIKLVLNYGLGPILFMILGYAIYHQVKHQPNLQEALLKLENNIRGRNSWMLYLSLVLMLLNWGIESRKWQVLIKPLEHIGFLHSFRAILSGIAFSISTPNRVGEYGGRVLYVKDGHRWQAVSLTIVGSFSQLIVTFIFGLGGLLFLLENPVTAAGIESYRLWIRVLFFGSFLITVFITAIYFRLGWMVKLLHRLPGSHRIIDRLTVIENLPVTFLLRVLCLSFGRYLVFVIQYILLLQLFDVQVSVWQAFWLVSVLYLVLAIVPTIALAEVGVRGEVSLILFALVSSNKIGIISAATGIWFINLVIPAIAGSLLFLGIKIFSDK
jgi:Lysylphosphatidylglycerol synthase TM region